MNGKLKYSLGLLAVVLVVFGAYNTGLQRGLSQTVTEAPKISGKLTVEVWREGELIYHYETHNLITTIGSKYVRNILGFDNVTSPAHNATKWLSLSNDATPVKTWTKLANELTTDGLDRKEDTSVTVINATAYQVDYTWTYTGASQGVQCSGLQWSDVDDSDNNLFAAATFTSVTLTTNDQIKVTEEKQ